MINLILNSDILKHTESSMLQRSILGGMNYPLFHRMAKGNWSSKALDVLARYLYANGHTAESLKDVKFTDIFTVTEAQDGSPQ